MSKEIELIGLNEKWIHVGMGAIIPHKDYESERNRKLTRAMTYITEEVGEGHDTALEIFNELSSLMEKNKA